MGRDHGAGEVSYLAKVAEEISLELTRVGYTPSDGKILEPWDRPFFGKRAPEERQSRRCSGKGCVGTMQFFDSSKSHITGQWQCDTCTRLHAATIAETIGALRCQLGSEGEV